MKGEVIRIPASLCPLHIGHDAFVKKLITKTGRDVHIDLQGAKGMGSSKLQERVRIKDNFIPYKVRREVLEQYVSGKERLTWGERTLHDIDVEGTSNAIGSDIFIKIIYALENKTNRKFKILQCKNLYVIERGGYEIPLNYNDILVKAGYSTNITAIPMEPVDMSGYKIRKIYEADGLSGIRDFVSEDTFNILSAYL